MLQFVDEKIYKHLQELITKIYKTLQELIYKHFFEAAERRNLVFNKSKTILTTTKLPILGFEIEKGQIRPDPKRLEPLPKMQVSNTAKSLSRSIFLILYFSYY